MKEWCLTHPYLTFMIIGLIILEIDAVLTIINNKIKLKHYELSLKEKEQQSLLENKKRTASSLK